MKVTYSLQYQIPWLNTWSQLDTYEVLERAEKSLSFASERMTEENGGQPVNLRIIKITEELAWMTSKSYDSASPCMRTNTVTNSEEKPLYEHDCSRCVYLGRHQYDNENFDLYACDKEFEPTLIARLSSEGRGYNSGLHFATQHYSLIAKHPLAEALRRAVRLAASSFAVTERASERLKDALNDLVSREGVSRDILVTRALEEYIGRQRDIQSCREQEYPHS